MSNNPPDRLKGGVTPHAEVNGFVSAGLVKTVNRMARLINNIDGQNGIQVTPMGDRLTISGPPRRSPSSRKPFSIYVNADREDPDNIDYQIVMTTGVHYWWDPTTTASTRTVLTLAEVSATASKVTCIYTKRIYTHSSGGRAISMETATGNDEAGAAAAALGDEAENATVSTTVMIWGYVAEDGKVTQELDGAWAEKRVG